MNEKELKLFVENFSYKDEWKFSINCDPVWGGAPAFEIRWKLPDIDNPEKYAIISNRFFLLPMRDAEMLANHIWQVIAGMEDHERLEHFKYNGRSIWPAHGDNGIFLRSRTGRARV